VQEANRFKLTKEDEQAVGDEIEVRREDQDKINKFSRLNQRQLGVEEALKIKNVRICGSTEPPIKTNALWS
jgi:hypothetical protein